MAFNHKKVESSLEKKGFELQTRRDHHVYILLDEKGLRTPVRTKTSHNKQDIGDNLCHLMAKQLSLTKGQFQDLINCPLSREEYLEIVKRAGKI